MVTVLDMLFGIFFVLVIPIGLWVFGHGKVENYTAIDITMSIASILLGLCIIMPKKIKQVFDKELY